jgi:hypothetical protein
MSPPLPGLAVIVLQVTSCGKISAIGSLLLIRGRITTLPANRTTKGPRHGSFKATRSQNGSHRDRVRFYGSTENVSCRMALTLSQGLIVSPLRSGLREKRTLVR